jgi:glycosyltransferase involved in cell wall biosynthesis
MVVLNMMRQVLSGGAVDAIAVAKDGGHLIEDFAALAPLEVLGRSKASSPAAHDLETLLASIDRRPAAAFCNSILTADLVPVFRRHGVPVLSLVHEMPTTIRFFGEDTIRTIDQYANAVVFGSEFVRDRTVAEFSCQNPNLHVVPTGYPAPERDRARVAAARKRLRCDAGLPEDTIVVLGCGIVEHRKGADLFPQIAKTLRDLPAAAGVRFVWIGQEMRDLYSTWLRHDVAALHLTETVRFLGPCLDIDQYVPGADIFALPSREDPLPLVTLAAFASGVPVVAFSGAGGAPEAIGDQAGMVVPYLDVGSMARAIATLAADAPLRARLGAGARQRFDTHYSMTVFLKRLLAILQVDAGVTLKVNVARTPAVPSAASCA